MTERRYGLALLVDESLERMPPAEVHELSLRTGECRANKEPGNDRTCPLGRETSCVEGCNFYRSDISARANLVLRENPDIISGLLKERTDLQLCDPGKIGRPSLLSRMQGVPNCGLEISEERHSPHANDKLASEIIHLNPNGFMKKEN